ncbi:nuclear transport factor 2 family protein [Pyxidicoccus fallax]|uniref:Nuclear transport factor 2 family protein n=1 Tax=Pyxidicoccus fallax TaxID=394095 RepID=A0A848LX07_9BACT|nr:nuclear transport factor 2 family protein [Pyxidicoccus fallax]NMO22140.1 nuclear transport factor 2 family protein [Pyxidicoccus fallax]NPC83717.1 nuclear transport factor 2 family protein [Pyxidicoccus fallax]
MLKPLATCLMLLALAAHAAAPKPEDAVIEALHAGCEAFRTGNESLAAGFLGDGFTLTDTSGNVTTREQTLLELRNKEPRYEVFRNHDMKVRLYGDTAVVNGITSLKGVAGGKPFTSELRFTDTLIKRNGKWRLVASHVSPLPKPKEEKQGRAAPAGR